MAIYHEALKGRQRAQNLLTIVPLALEVKTEYTDNYPADGIGELIEESTEEKEEGHWETQMWDEEDWTSAEEFHTRELPLSMGDGSGPEGICRF